MLVPTMWEGSSLPSVDIAGASALDESGRFRDGPSCDRSTNDQQCATMPFIIFYEWAQHAQHRIHTYLMQSRSGLLLKKCSGSKLSAPSRAVATPPNKQNVFPLPFLRTCLSFSNEQRQGFSCHCYLNLAQVLRPGSTMFDSTSWYNSKPRMCTHTAYWCPTKIMMEIPATTAYERCSCDSALVCCTRRIWRTRYPTKRK